MNRELLREATEWRLMSLLFTPPENGWKREISALASEVQDQQLKNAAIAACEEGDKALYHTLLGPGGMLSPRAVGHGLGMMPGKMLAQLKGFYEAFAYSPSLKEPPDHVAVMTDFIAYLRLKQALGDPKQADTAAKASMEFIRDHLRSLADSLDKAVEQCQLRYLSLATKALLGRVAGVTRRSP